MRLPEQFIEQVRTRNDIVEVIAQTVALKRTGKNYSGLCPFHSEKTPSFSVSPDKQIFYCFGCHQGGDVFKFVQLRDSVDFIGAVRILADRAGLELPQEDRSPEEEQRYRELEAMYQACELAASYYHSYLLNSANAAEARAYLERRGLSAETIERFRLGYAPPTWDSLLNALQPRGVKPETLVRVGLAKRSERREGFYDQFRNRVIFPIANGRGRIIAFGGRVLDDSLPKYLNSTETPIFVKGRNLFALNLAREAIRAEGQVIMVEGYMDTVSLHQVGIRNVVASLGTALTSDQASLLQQYAREVIIAYDADAAGQRATLRGLEVMSASGCTLRVATVPDGKDPDDYVRAHGREATQAVFHAAVPFIKYRFQRAATGQNLQTVAGKQAVLRQVLPLVGKVSSAVEQDDYLQLLASELQLDMATLRRELARAARRESQTRHGGPIASPLAHVAEVAATSLPEGGNNGSQERDNKEAAHHAVTIGPSPVPRARFLAEQDLLRAMIAGGEARTAVARELGVDGFGDPRLRVVAGTILAMAEAGTPFTVAQVLDRLPTGEIHQLATRIFFQEVEYRLSAESVAGYIRAIKDLARTARIEQLLTEIRQVQTAGQDPRPLVEEYQQLIRDAKGSKRDG